jgi:hypothetical protein
MYIGSPDDEFDDDDDDDEHFHDVEVLSDYDDPYSGEGVIVQLGFGAGDMKRGAFLKKKRRNRKRRSNASRREQQLRNSLMGLPGAALSMTPISPLIINHGSLNSAPTKGLIPGAAFVDTLRRFETTYPGTTRTQTFPAAAGTQVVTFAAPTAAEGGNVLWTPVIFFQIGMQRNNSVSAAQVSVTLTSGIKEDGQAADARSWSFLLDGALDSLFGALIPFTDISSVIYPNIVEGDAVNNLVVTFDNLPTGSNLRVIMPGPDSAQYEAFLKGFGVSSPNDRLAKTF